MGGNGATIRIFTFSCVAWLLLRFLPGTSVPSPGVASTVSVVRASPSPVSGRYEISGLPDAADDPSGLFRAPEIVGALARLDGRVEGANEQLALGAREVAGRIETFPDRGVTGIRISGALVPFHERDGDRLARARREATERPWVSLETVREIVDSRLSEPDEGLLVEDVAQRRELTRLLRNTEGSLQDRATSVGWALDEFRREALDAAARAQGPFRRHGTGRILELVLAAWLGTTLREALRRRRAAVPPELSLTFAPVLAAAVVLMLEGSAVLPVDPVRGLSLAFLPLSFLLGFACSAILLVASRLERVIGTEDPGPAELAPNPPHPARPRPTRPRPTPPPLPRAGEVLEQRPDAPPEESRRPRSEREAPDTRPTDSPREPRPGFFPKRRVDRPR
jgi:hypothetical protein